MSNNTAWMSICPTMAEELLNFPGRIEAYLNHYKSLGLLRKANNLLSIGGGQGDIELALLKDFEMNVAFIEPSDELSSKFRSNSQSFAPQVIEIFQGPFQDYSSTHTFDVCLSVYSWANMGYSTEALKKALTLLTPSGKLVISMGSAEDVLTLCYKIAFPDRDDNMSAEEFEVWATSKGFVFESVEFLRKAPTHTLVQDNQLTKACQALFAYWGNCHWNDFTVGVRNEIEKLLLNAAKEGAFYFKGRTAIFPSAL